MINEIAVDTLETAFRKFDEDLDLHERISCVEACFKLPDGSRWIPIHPSSNFGAFDDELFNLLDRHQPDWDIDSDDDEIPYLHMHHLMIDYDKPNPEKVFCSVCGWINLYQAVLV